MNGTPFRIAAGATVVALAISGLGLAYAQAAPVPSAPTLDAATAKTLSFMREEERLARDLYTALEGKHGDGVRPFAHIKLSEQQHFEAVGTLLSRFGIEDPSVGLAAGDYRYDELDEMYKTLLGQGEASLAAAYQAGVTFETNDIAGLKKAIEESPEASVDDVLTNLLTASERHLAAFERAASGDMPAGPGGGNGPRGPMGSQGSQGNGPGRWQDVQPDGTASGPGRRMHRQGAGAGGMNRTGERPADCPLA